MAISEIKVAERGEYFKIAPRNNASKSHATAGAEGIVDPTLQPGKIFGPKSQEITGLPSSGNENFGLAYDAVCAVLDWAGSVQ